MTKRSVLVASLIIAILSFNFFLKPYLQFKDALKIVKTILTHWENNDLTLAMSYWEKEIDSPPIYSLMSYEIGKGEITKKDGMYSAQINVTLDFSLDSHFPSGKNWIFKLNKTRYGWKVKDFRLIEDEIPQ